jgi:hypothetical protein
MRQRVPELPPDVDASRLVERPDGFYWRHADSGELVGPFPTLLDAVNDMTYDPEAELAPGETLEEAESEIGMSDWVDPETGEPAEEQVPRIEEH